MALQGDSRMEKPHKEEHNRLTGLHTLTPCIVVRIANFKLCILSEWGRPENLLRITLNSGSQRWNFETDYSVEISLKAGRDPISLYDRSI
jgi:hypothetical protein